MHRFASRGWWAAALLLAFAASAGEFAPRQYYGGIQRHPTGGYHYRSFYYKPTATYKGFRHHYAIYHPQRPKFIYFYNPYKKQFWGGCPTKYDGAKPRYSLLPPEQRKAKLSEIPDSAFPEPGDLPPIPESSDGATIELPPDDLPNESP